MDKESGFYYIGSSVDVAKRIKEHKKAQRSKKEKYRKVYQHINMWSVDVITVSSITCNSRLELWEEENKFIKECINAPKCCNVNLPFLTNEEKTENKILIKQFVKQQEEKSKQRDISMQLEKEPNHIKQSIENENPQQNLKLKKRQRTTKCNVF